MKLLELYFHLKQLSILYLYFEYFKFVVTNPAYNSKSNILFFEKQQQKPKNTIIKIIFYFQKMEISISIFVIFLLQVVSHDGWNCIDCPEGKIYNSANKKCAPCTGTLQTDIDTSQAGEQLTQKKCLTCKDKTEPSISSDGVCKRCHSQVLKVTSGASCACSTSPGIYIY